MPYHKRYNRKGAYRRRRNYKRGMRKRFYRRKGARASYNRKYDAITYRAPRPRGALGGAFAQAYFTKLPFKSSYSEDQGVASYSLQEYTPCDLNDVRSTVGYQWASRLLDLYNRWVCLGFSWKFSVSNLDPLSMVEFFVLPWSSNEDPTAGVGLIRWQTGVIQRDIGPAVGGGNQLTIIKGYTSLKRITGVNVVNEEEYWGNITTAPTNQPRLYVAQQNSRATAILDFQYTIEIIGYFKFFSPNLQPTGPSLTDSVSSDRRKLFGGIPFSYGLKPGTVIGGTNCCGENWGGVPQEEKEKESELESKGLNEDEDMLCLD